MFRGIFAGDIAKLSIKSCLPEIYKLEREYGSVARGMMTGKKEGTNFNILKYLYFYRMLAVLNS